MHKYTLQTIDKVKKLRSLGKTYGEIIKLLGFTVPKSTLSYWCEDVALPLDYTKRIAKLNINNLNKGRQIAMLMNKIKRERLLKEINENNLPLAKNITNREIAKVALAMLCLGEASKYNPKTRTSFSLGSSDNRIIILFLELIKICFNFDIEKVRCTVQCRADQNIKELENYWLKVTKVPKRLFYKSRIDPRTKGKPTKNKKYKGVLRVDYFDRKVQFELESLANLIYNQITWARSLIG